VGFVAAVDTGKARLAFAASPVNAAAHRTGLRRKGGGNFRQRSAAFFEFVGKDRFKRLPALSEDRAIQPGFLPHVAARLGERSLRACRHVADFQVFKRDVSPKKLAKTTMAKSIYDAGWSNFKTMLSYKAIMHGGSVIEVSERYSTQICSCCGCNPVSSPKGRVDLDKRRWVCDDCGTEHDRDRNAALNILRVGLDALGGAHV
jgi:hypothetical protein